MSKQSKQTFTCASFSPFSGIDTHQSHAGIVGTADLVNFRLDKDGSLHKREGYHYLCEAPSPLRAFWTGKLAGKMQTFMLSGSHVMRFDYDTETVTEIGRFSTLYSEHVHFFFYRDRLYLVTKHNLHQIEENGIREIQPYIPLIGKDWPTTIPGEIYEPRNLLTTRARIHYLIPANPSLYLPTAYSVASIESVYLNDVLLSASNYSYDDSVRAIRMQGLNAGDRVRVHLTYTTTSEGRERWDLQQCTYAEIFGDTQNSRIFIWNGPKKNAFFPSRFVSEEALSGSKKVNANSVPLYFPEGCCSIPGDGRNDITGFARQYDRLLILTESEAFMLNTEDLQKDTPSAKPINPSIGCYGIFGCALVDNTPFTLGEHDIYRWTADTDEYDLCNAYSITEPVPALTESDFLKNARMFFYRAKRELWVYAPGYSTDVWIYQLDTKSWYRFSGIHADHFFEIDGKLYFSVSNYILKFDDSFYEDINENGTRQTIVATFRSNLLEYGSSSEKHFSKLTLRADCNGSPISVTLDGDGSSVIHHTFFKNAPHTVFVRRLSSGRFHTATLSLTAGGLGRQTVHSLISDVR